MRSIQYVAVFLLIYYKSFTFAATILATPCMFSGRNCDPKINSRNFCTGNTCTCNGSEIACCGAGKYASSDDGLCYCNNGWFGNKGSEGSCTACSAGSDSTFPYTEQCTPCRKGTANNAPGYPCATCISGYFANVTGLSTCYQCPAEAPQSSPEFSSCICTDASKQFDATSGTCVLKPCSPGTYRDGDSCSPCPSHSYCLGDNVAPQLCPVGSIPDTTTNATCVSACPEDQFFASIGTCISCDFGKYLIAGVPFNSSTPESFTNATCATCPDGTLPSDDRTTCVSEGFFQNDKFPNSTSGQFEVCPAGRYINQNTPVLLNDQITYVNPVFCRECPVGTANQYDGVRYCRPCDEGTYASTTGSTDCTPCPTGSYVSTTGSTICLSCPYATFANETGLTSCHQCPYGTNTTMTGSDSETDCAPPSPPLPSSPPPPNLCALGSFGSGENQCALCDFASFANETGLPSCYRCPDGTNTTKKGSNSSTDCVSPPPPPPPLPKSSPPPSPCVHGSFGTGGSECALCDFASFANETGLLSCYRCPDGTNTTKKGSNSSTDCVSPPPPPPPLLKSSPPPSPCVHGSFGTGGSECALCDFASFANETGLPSCYRCPDGTNTTKKGSNSSTDCVSPPPPPPPLPKSSPPPSPCVHGSFGTGGSECALCDFASFANETGLLSCYRCPDGTNTTKKGSNSSTDCVSPPPPPPPLLKSSPPPSPCVHGSFGTGGSECALCDFASFANETGLLSCYRCPDGTNTTKKGSNSSTDCVSPPPPPPPLPKSSPPPSPCVHGSFGTGGSECALCDFASFANETGLLSCYRCPDGTNTTKKGSNSSTDCVSPPPPPPPLPKSSPPPSPCVHGSFGTGGSKCALCDFASFANETGLLSCYRCPDGTNTTKKGSNSSTDCVSPPPPPPPLPKSSPPPSPCVHGSFGTGGSECALCDFASFANETGLLSCYRCPDGTNTTKKGSNSSTDCVSPPPPPPPLPKSSPPPSPCVHGSFGTGGSKCALCDFASFANETGLLSCYRCPDGTNTTKKGSNSSTDCVSPPPPPPPLPKSSPPPSPCVHGSFGTGGSECALCDFASFANETGLLSCYRCPDGTNTTKKGSNSSTDCVSPPPPPPPLPKYSPPPSPCVHGSFGTGGSECALCDFASFANETGLLSCYRCPDGTNTTKKGSNSSTDCVSPPPPPPPLPKSSPPPSPCVHGSFGTGGSECALCDFASFANETGLLSCYRCPDGTNTTKKGSNSSTDCVSPPPPPPPLPKYSPPPSPCVHGSFGTGGSECALCDFASFANETGLLSCYRCPDGTNTTKKGSNSSTDCVSQPPPPPPLPKSSPPPSPCVHGSFGTGGSECALCDFASFANETGLLSCYRCPDGTNTTKKGSNSSTDCVSPPPPPPPLPKSSPPPSPCVHGSFGTGGSECALCDFASFANETGLLSCYRCPDGTNTTKKGSNSSTDCVSPPPPPPPLPKSSPPPSPCVHGSFGTGGSECALCDFASFANDTGLLSCYRCPDGTNTTKKGSNSSTDCVSPPPPPPPLPKSSPPPSPCVHGSFGTGGSECALCDFASFANDTGLLSCYRCPDGTNTTKKGSNSSTDCVSPPPPPPPLPKSSPPPSPCVHGSFGTGGSECALCDFASFANDTGLLSCYRCPDGTNTTKKGSNSSTDCVPPPSPPPPASPPPPLPCSVGKFGSSGFCQLCPKGSYANTTGLSKCYSCPETYTTATTGASSSFQCGPCSGGFQLNNFGCCGDAKQDCSGNCGGSAVFDSCGVCGDSSSLNGNGCCGSQVKDCKGICGGSAIKDCAGECGGVATCTATPPITLKSSITIKIPVDKTVDTANSTTICAQAILAYCGLNPGIDCSKVTCTATVLTDSIGRRRLFEVWTSIAYWSTTLAATITLESTASASDIQTATATIQAVQTKTSDTTSFTQAFAQTLVASNPQVFPPGITLTYIVVTAVATSSLLPPPPVVASPPPLVAAPVPTPTKSATPPLLPPQPPLNANLLKQRITATVSVSGVSVSATGADVSKEVCAQVASITNVPLSTIQCAAVQVAKRRRLFAATSTWSVDIVILLTQSSSVSASAIVVQSKQIASVLSTLGSSLSAALTNQDAVLFPSSTIGVSVTTPPKVTTIPSNASPAPTPTTPTPSQSMSTGVLIIVIVGPLLGVLLIIIGVAAWYRTHRRKRRNMSVSMRNQPLLDKREDVEQNRYKRRFRR
jgi:hypothetical protein